MPDRITILVVDDHPETTRTAARILELTGYRAIAANTMSEALKLCASQRFDAALIDLQLPDGSGSDLARTLERECGIPCIACSGYPKGQTPPELGMYEFNEYLLKPIAVIDMLAAIQRALSRRLRPDVTKQPSV